MSMMDTIWFIVFQFNCTSAKQNVDSDLLHSRFCFFYASSPRVLQEQFVRFDQKVNSLLHIKPFLYIISTYCLISTKMMEAGGWTQHDDWLKCSVFIHRKAGKIEDNLQPDIQDLKLTRANIWRKGGMTIKKEGFLEKEGEAEVQKNNEEGEKDHRQDQPLCGFTEKGVGTFLFKQNYSKLFYDPSKALEVPLKSLIINLYDKYRELVLQLQISNDKICLKRHYGEELKDITTHEKTLIFPSPQTAPKVFRKKLWVQVNKLNFSLRVSVGDTANFETDELFFYNFNQDQGSYHRNTWGTQQNTFLMPEPIVMDSFLREKKIVQSRVENVLGTITYFKIETILADEAVKQSKQSLNDFLKIKFMNLVRDLSPVLDLNTSILNQKSAHLAIVPRPIEILYTYLKNLSVVNLPEFESRSHNLVQKDSYQSWYDFQYAIHSSLITPYGYRKGYRSSNDNEEVADRPVGIMNHLFKVKHKKRYVPFEAEIGKFDTREDLMNHIYNQRAGYIRLELLPNQGLGPGSMAVLEAWPPYCCSTVHNHGQAFGLIKVLSGTIRVQNYSDLNFYSIDTPNPYLQSDYSQNQYTWLSQQSFGIHRLVNTHSQTCLTLQSYYHDKISNEYFQVLKRDKNQQKYIEYFPQNDWKNYLNYPRQCEQYLKTKRNQNKDRQMTAQEWQRSQKEDKQMQWDIDFIKSIIKMYKLDKCAELNCQFYKLALILKDQYGYVNNFGLLNESKRFLPKEQCKSAIYRISSIKSSQRKPEQSINFDKVCYLTRKDLITLLSNPFAMSCLSSKREDIYKESEFNASFGLEYMKKMDVKYGFPESLKIISYGITGRPVIEHGRNFYSVFNKGDLTQIVQGYL